MLKIISPVISPELLKILAEMEHGDEIVLADGNFASTSFAQRLIRADSYGIPTLLSAVLQLFPLDTSIEHPVALMAVVPGHNYRPTIWDEYRCIIKESGEPFSDFEYIERFAFYDRARKAYAVLATGESALYANIILKKGAVTI